MSKVAIAFSTKDRVALSQQSIMPLLDGARQGNFHLFWNDGSTTKEGEEFAAQAGYPTAYVTHNVRGGADAAIVFSLTQMLNHPEGYDYVGLVENDVLLHPDWFGPTMALFERAAAEGLEAGAVSARAYQDRILIQRDGYAIMHNIGAGMILLTRRAAEIVLRNFRTGWSMENRRTFMQLSGLDIGRWWFVRGNEQWITADWHFETVLAQHGLASLALTPSMCEMIGQVPPLAEQGLTMADGKMELLRNAEAFNAFCRRSKAIRDMDVAVSDSSWHGRHQSDDGQTTIFPHQVETMGGSYIGDWKLKWAQGFGPFAYRADADEIPAQCQVSIPISGACSFLVSGGKNGGKVHLHDEASGYTLTPELPPEGETGQVAQLVVPTGVSYRNVRLTALTPGIVFYGITTREPQPWLPHIKFDHSKLPPV